MRSSADYVSGNDDLVSGFDANTCSGENIYDILITRTELLLFGNGGSLKFLTVTCHRILIILKWYELIQKKGFY